ncbi:hypothetical protein ACPOL_2040 [Acidisarcina polymorpha]|uniref:Uncharacterized protein n=2 Tax=Acidisarcina polymorpha TaxID=2211140 RepID=A0A2Z5FYC5_9BACT|nr:hypothetical protein ACPOL_2040 [Acidisarcina polymorpha]
MLKFYTTRFWLAVLAVLGLTGVAGMTTGCGFFPKITTCTTNCTTASNFMYVANTASAGTAAGSVAGFSLTTKTTAATSTTPATSTLSLAVTPNSAYSLGFVPSAIAITPTNTFIYAASQTTGIFLYSVGSNGALTEENNSTAVASDLASSMQVDSTGSWLIVADASLASSNAIINVYSIASTTGLLTLSGTLNGVKVAGASRQLFIAPNNVNVFLTLSTGGTESLTLNATTGALTDQANLPPITTPNADLGVTTDPNSTFVFVTETGASAVRVLTIGTNGALTNVSGSPFATGGTGPAAVLVDSSGSYVYVANSTSNTVSGFVLAANGTLTAISGSPFATGAGPSGLAEDSTKTYLGVVCNGGGSDLEVYSFDATTLGKLDAAGNATTGTDPTLPIAIVASKAVSST